MREALRGEREKGKREAGGGGGHLDRYVPPQTPKVLGNEFHQQESL